MTTAVTEEYKRCLKSTAVKQSCLLQTRKTSFRAVIWTKRLEKLPQTYNKSFLITQSCRGRVKLQSVKSLNGLANFSLLFFPYPLSDPKSNLKTAHINPCVHLKENVVLAPASDHLQLSLLDLVSIHWNLSTMVTMETEESGHCRDLAVMWR